MALEGIVNFFSTMCETAETNKNPNKKMLITHYYASNYEKAKAAISSVCQSAFNLQIINVDDHYHELLFENKKLSLIITAYPVTPYEVSVDVKVKVYRLIGFNKTIKVLESFYNELNRRLILKRIGGGQNE